MTTIIYAIIGGLLIGGAAVALLAFNGRLAGISSILYGGLADKSDRAWRLIFIIGLLIGGVLAHQLFNIAIPTLTQTNILIVIAAGLLVGIGVRIGSGCTSGHGVCGIGRLSIRSIVATLTFMLTGVITVLITQYF